MLIDLNLYVFPLIIYEIKTKIGMWIIVSVLMILRVFFLGGGGGGGGERRGMWM